MKFVRKKYINESIFKSVEDIKKERDAKELYNADSLVNDSIKVILNAKKKIIDILMMHWFVCSGWWANSPLSTNCNLRPGDEQLADFNTYLGDIRDKSKDEQIAYLYNKIHFSTKIENGIIIIEIPLKPSDFPINRIVIKGNSLFNYLNEAEKCFKEHLKFPVKIKIRLENVKTDYIQIKKIVYIQINQNVSAEKLVNFFKDRVVNPEILDYENLELRVLNNTKSVVPLFELGNYVKFNVVVFKLTSEFLTRRYHGAYNPDLIIYDSNVDTLDGVENLLKDTETCKVRIAKIYRNSSSELEENIKDKPYIEDL